MTKPSKNGRLVLRSQDKPQGYFNQKDDWSKDTNNKYFKGPMDKVVWPLIKLFAIIGLWFVQVANDVTLLTIFTSTLGVILVYQYLVALALGYSVMPAMD